VLLRLSRSIKVTDVGTNPKNVCDFLLVINSNWHPILYRFEVIADCCLNFGHCVLGSTYAIRLRLLGKRVVDFLLVLIELFARCYGCGATSENTVWVKKVAALKLFAAFSLLVYLCNWKLPWLLPKHIHMSTPVLVHLSEYVCEMYNFYPWDPSNFKNSIQLVTKFMNVSYKHKSHQMTIVVVFHSVHHHHHHHHPRISSRRKF